MAADDNEQQETPPDKGVVPFLKDLLAAFISTLMLMIFGVNFLMFTSLSRDGLDDVFNVGGETCSSPCLSYPSRDLVEDAMTERAEGLRRRLCTKAYGRQTLEVGDLKIPNQECQDCHPIVAYFWVILDFVVAVFNWLKHLVRSVICMLVQALKAPILMFVGLFAQVMGTLVGMGKKGMKALTATAEVEKKGAEALEKMADNAGGGDDKKEGQKGGAGLRDSIRTARGAMSSAGSAVSSRVSAAGSAAGNAMSSGASAAKARVGQGISAARKNTMSQNASSLGEGLVSAPMAVAGAALKPAGAIVGGVAKGLGKAIGKPAAAVGKAGMDAWKGEGAAAKGAATGMAGGVIEMIKEFIDGLGGCCQNNTDCTEEYMCGAGSKCRLKKPPEKGPGIRGECPVMLAAKPINPQKLQAAQEAQRELAAESGVSAAQSGVSQGGGGSRKRQVGGKLGLGGSRKRGQRGGAGLLASMPTAPGQAPTPPTQGAPQPGGAPSGMSVDEQEVHNATIRAKKLREGGHESAFCKAMGGDDACVKFEQSKLGYGTGGELARYLRRAQLDADKYKSILYPSWPYSGWFGRNRREAIELARGGNMASNPQQLPVRQLREKYTRIARQADPDMGDPEIHALVTERIDVEIGRRTEAILTGKWVADPRDMVAVQALNTSKRAQVENKGLFRYVGGGPAPVQVTGSTPYDDRELFGGKWGNWLAASTSSTAIGYRKVMRGLSTFFSGTPGTTNPTSIWIRLLVAVIIFSLFGASLFAVPVELGGTIFGIMYLYSLWQHFRTAPLGWGWPISDCIGLWGILWSFIISPIQAIVQTVTCVFYLTFYFVFRYSKAAVFEVKSRAWGPALVLFSLLTIGAAWRRLDIYEFVPMAVTIGVGVSAFIGITRWWSAAHR